MEKSMKITQQITDGKLDTQPDSDVRHIAKVCLASCRKLIANIQKTKEAILSEFRQSLDAPERLLRLALNEAEAVAWQTGYPQLVFPLLATEKVQNLAASHARQRSVAETASGSA